MHATHDYLYQYHGFWRPGGVCRIRIFEQDGLPPVVICSDQRDNPGTSVSSMAEYLSAEIMRAHFPHLFDATEEPMVWIEEYPRLSGELLTAYARVRFDSYSPHLVLRAGGLRRLIIGRPHWTPITQVELEALIGQPLDEQGEEPTVLYRGA